MRKNLHYKVLASVLAICALNYALPNNALANDYEVQANNETVTGIYGIVDGNGYKFTFDGQATNIYGVDKYSSSGDAEDANEANVTIKNNSIITNVYGGYSYSMDGNSGDATCNYVTINDSSADYVYGGYSDSSIGSSGNATDNHVTINNSTVNYVYGGYSDKGNILIIM